MRVWGRRGNEEKLISFCRMGIKYGTWDGNYKDDVKSRLELANGDFFHQRK